MRTRLTDTRLNLATCLPRPVFDSMLMRFPERRLEDGGEEFAETDD